MALETLWYCVIGASILFYTILDGFDLGVGILHLFGKGDTHRRLFLNSIGPVWDGNEVWIVIMMGALFAGFPGSYASLFSGFYSLLMFLIMGLMFRAAAIEFRSKQESPRWRSIWDVVFSVASHLVTFVLGLILGNVIEGVPIDASQNFSVPFAHFFRPYPLIIGFTSIALFGMHGAIYLVMKTEGEAHDLIRRWIPSAIASFVVWYIVATIATILYVPHIMVPMKENPILLIFPLLSLIAILNVPYQMKHGRDGWAFIFSSLTIAFLLIVYSIGSFPVLVYSTIDPAYSLTIYNTSSTQKTLGVLMVVVGIGIPLVLAYGFWVYRIFRGKVRLEKNSY